MYTVSTLVQKYSEPHIFCTQGVKTIIDSAQIEKYRSILTGETDDDHAAQLVRELGDRCTPWSVDLLLESLTIPDFKLKRDVVEALFNCFCKEAIEGLLVLIKLGGPPLDEEITALLKDLDPVPVLTNKLKEWIDNPGEFRSVAASIELLGYFGDERTVEAIVPFLTHVDNPVKEAAIRSLAVIGDPSCVESLLNAVHYAEEYIVLQIIDLIGSFQAASSVLPLFQLMERNEQTILEKIISILTSFPPEEVEFTIENNLEGSSPELLRNALSLLEAAGRMSACERIRTRFKKIVQSQSDREEKAKDLSLDFKKNGDMAFLTLGGLLNADTFPKFRKNVKYLLTTGFLKIFLLCNKLKKIDSPTLKLLNLMGRKLLKIGGQLLVVDMHAAPAAWREHLLEDIECYETIREAVLSFSNTRISEIVILAPEMLKPGTNVELQIVASLKKTVTRAVKVISFDGQFLNLEWFPFEEHEIFKENLSPSVKLILIQRLRVLQFETVVVKQDHSAPPSITLSRPRRGKLIGFRRYVRVFTDIQVVFYHVVNSSKIRRELKGCCKNLSVKGMLLVTNLEIPLNDVVISVFTNHPLLEGEKIPGRVVQVRKSISGDEVYYEYGISFLLLTPGVQEKLTRTVYKNLSALLDDSS